MNDLSKDSAVLIDEAHDVFFHVSFLDFELWMIFTS